jgi:formylmethanofuran dehydrogenase subunit E
MFEGTGSQLQKENSMNADEIMRNEDFKKCSDFHGHICPGLVIGYRAARAGLDWLKEKRATDEELVSVVETDACSADAVQVLTGCTFGKGNFLYKDYGKMVFTFFGRASGKGVRVALRPGVLQLTDRHLELVDKIRNAAASQEEHQEYVSMRDAKTRDILEKDLKILFKLEPVNVSLPPKALIHASKPCDRCGEPTMVSKLVQQADRYICGSCLDSV